MVAIDEMKNLGPKSKAWLQAAGIENVEALNELGAVEVYRRVKAIEPRASLNLLYGLQAALLDIHWTDLPPDMKADLKAQVTE